MSKIALTPNASGTGTLTVAAPNTNTNRTITLPDATGTAIINKGSEIFNIDSAGNLGMGTSSPVGAGLTLNLQGSTSSSYSSIVAGSPSNANFVSFYSGQTADPNPSIVYNNSLRIGSATSPNTSGYVERMRIDSSGNLLFNSGYGSVATAYGCRAWVNFNGTGTVAIRASGNVSSITDNNTGEYTVNFTTAMPDANYAVTCSATGVAGASGTNLTAGPVQSTQAVGSIQVTVRNPTTRTDADIVSVAIFR
jgi:hypothetical protein